jgi:hypothetical protein
LLLKSGCKGTNFFYTDQKKVLEGYYTACCGDMKKRGGNPEVASSLCFLTEISSVLFG